MITKPYFSHLTTLLIVLIVANTGISRELIKIFEAKHGQPIASRYLPAGSGEKIWESTPNRVFLGEDGRIYLPADDKIRILNKEGIYIGDRMLNAEIDANCLFVKKLVGVDYNGRAWYYFPYFETSAPFDNDYRHCLVAIDETGGIVQSARLNIPFSQSHPYFHYQILSNGRFFLRGSGGGYLVDIGSNTVTYTDYEAYDVLGNGYRGAHKWNNTYQANQLSLKRLPARNSKNAAVTAGVEATSMNELFERKASEGIAYFGLWAGTNQAGHIAYSLVRKPPGGQLNLPDFEYVIYDGSSDRIIEHDRVDWDVPPDQAPTVLFRQLEDDDSILIGVEEPNVAWKVVSDGSGITGTVIFPGPKGLTFRIYRLQ